MKRLYETQLYRDPTKTILITLFLMLLMIAGIVYLARLYHLPLLGIGLSMVIFIISIVTARTIRRRSLSKKAILDFDLSVFSITLYPPDSESISSRDVFAWRDIAAYRFYFDTKNNTCLTLYLKDKKKKTYIFNENKTFEEAVSENSVFSNFLSFVKQFNQTGKKISPRPSLLATTTGKFIIYFEIALIIFAFILHVITREISRS